MGLLDRLREGRIQRSQRTQEQRESALQNPVYTFAGWANGRPLVNAPNGDSIECDRLLRNGSIVNGAVVAVLEASDYRIICNEKAPKRDRPLPPVEPTTPWLYDYFGGVLVEPAGVNGLFNYVLRPAELVPAANPQFFQAPALNDVCSAASNQRGNAWASASPTTRAFEPGGCQGIIYSPDIATGVEVGIVNFFEKIPTYPGSGDPIGDYYDSVLSACRYVDSGTFDLSGTLRLNSSPTYAFSLAITIFTMAEDSILNDLATFDEVAEQLSTAAQTYYPGDYAESRAGTLAIANALLGSAVSADYSSETSEFGYEYSLDFATDLGLTPIRRAAIAINADTTLGDYSYSLDLQEGDGDAIRYLLNISNEDGGNVQAIYKVLEAGYTGTAEEDVSLPPGRYFVWLGTIGRGYDSIAATDARWEPTVTL